MDKEIAELKSYLPEWTSAKRSKKWGVFTAITGDGDSFMKTKDWEAVKTVWQEYTQEQFGAGAWDGG
ncbi:hypothetical protein BDR04DRAFT_1152078 [Suillus decipiens]|nr:hypothetical protein BDR04DRAFT_1152078 [Suillus decipiens]